MGGEDSVFGVIAAAIGGLAAILVARISRPGPGEDEDELKVSPEIWQRFERLERKVDHLTALVETKKAEVSALEKLLRSAMRIVRRQQRRLRAHGDRPEEVPLELIPYSID
ncbi:hypothetical protein ACWCWD_06245 [Streptomyces sp. NPDC001493]